MKLENQQTGAIIPAILIINRPNDLKFAAIPLLERWKKAFEKMDIGGKVREREVEVAETADVFNSLNEKTMVALGNYVVDDTTLEYIAETIYPKVKENEIHLLKNKNGDICPVFVAGANVFKPISALDFQKSENVMEEIKQKSENSEKISLFIEEAEDGFWGKITDSASAKEAEWGFLKFLQHRPSGIVAEYINNLFSTRITRRLLKYRRITPNLVTIVDFFIGLFALSLFFIPTNCYFWGILAVLILQFNSILDCVDGEIARARLQQTRFGANLDSFSDETIAMLTHVAIGWNLMTMGFQNRFFDMPPEWFFYIGIFNGFVSYLYAMINFHSRWKNNGVGFYFWWDLKKSIKVRRRKKTVGFYLKHLFWRESIVFFLIFLTIFKLLDLFLIVSFIVSIVILILIFTHIFIKKAAW